MERVIAFGTFDPLHQGHKNFLSQAKKLGYLIVVVSSDDKVILEKGRQPRESAEVRKSKIADLNIADEVMVSDSGDKYDLIKALNPDIVVLGYDQKIPEPLKNKVKKYKIISLQPFKPEFYKSSKIVNQAPSSSG